MGYDIWQRGSSFCIRKENFPRLVKAAIQRFPTWFDEMSSVREIFKEFDFEVGASIKSPKHNTSTIPLIFFLNHSFLMCRNTSNFVYLSYINSSKLQDIG